MTLIDQYSQAAHVKELYNWTILPQSRFYYHPADGRKGIRPGTYAPRQDGSLVLNDQVVDDVKL